MSSDSAGTGSMYESLRCSVRPWEAGFSRNLILQVIVLARLLSFSTCSLRLNRVSLRSSLEKEGIFLLAIQGSLLS